MKTGWANQVRLRTSPAHAHPRHPITRVCHFLPHPHPHRTPPPDQPTGTRPQRQRIWNAIVSLFSADGTPAFEPISLDSVELITVGLDLQGWKRYLSWLSKFKFFLKDRAAQPVTAATLGTLIANNAAAVDFLSAVAKEDQGRSRPGTAAGALEFLRRVAGLPSIYADPRVTYLKRGVLKANPHTPKGARPLPELFLKAITEVWGRDDLWWKRMTTVVMQIAFFTLL